MYWDDREWLFVYDDKVVQSFPRKKYEKFFTRLGLLRHSNLLYRCVLLTVPYDQIHQHYENRVVAKPDNRLQWILTPKPNDDDSCFERAIVDIDESKQDIEQVRIKLSKHRYCVAKVLTIKRLKDCTGLKIEKPNLKRLEVR